jgi:hypothetical protein
LALIHRSARSPIPNRDDPRSRKAGSVERRSRGGPVCCGDGGSVVRNGLICRIAAHVDFRFPIDTGGGLRLSAAYQADDIFGQTKRCRLAKIFASMHRSSATASATVEAFGSDP